MKRFFEDELSMEEVKGMLRNLKRKSHSNTLLIVFCSFGIAVMLAALAFLAFKCKEKNSCCCEDDFEDDDFDDDDYFDDDEDEDCDCDCCDKDGCYADEKDFEK